jgi:ABC-type glutathione transport system ATPase component
MNLFVDLKTRLGTAFLVIAHNMGMLAKIADRVMVMNAGRIVAEGTPERLFRRAPTDDATDS